MPDGTGFYQWLYERGDLDGIPPHRIRELWPVAMVPLLEDLPALGICCRITDGYRIVKEGDPDDPAVLEAFGRFTDRLSRLRASGSHESRA